MPECRTLSYSEIKHILPHTYPFLLIDRVDDYKENEYLIAIKNTTVNEWPFVGIGRQTFNYPETLLIEAAAQAALVLYHVTKIKNINITPRYILGKVKANFSETIEIGETIKITVKTGKILDMGGYFNILVSTSGGNNATFELFFSVKRG